MNAQETLIVELGLEMSTLACRQASRRASRLIIKTSCVSKVLLAVWPSGRLRAAEP